MLSARSTNDPGQFITLSIRLRPQDQRPVSAMAMVHIGLLLLYGWRRDVVVSGVRQ